jgi:hypothetical protein
LRGAADVMIECSRGELKGPVSLKCDKMKVSEPFPAARLGLERITLGPSPPSLAVADWQEALEANSRCHSLFVAPSELNFCSSTSRALSAIPVHDCDRTIESYL